MKDYKKKLAGFVTGVLLSVALIVCGSYLINGNHALKKAFNILADCNRMSACIHFSQEHGYLIDQCEETSARVTPEQCEEMFRKVYGE